MSINPTSEQMDAFLSFLEKHRDLARGHLRNAEERNRSRQLWVQLTVKLNALDGCTKTTKKWQKVWTDKKYLAKKAAAAARQSAAQLTPQEQRIIQLMGEGQILEPDTDARVPAFPENPHEQVQVVNEEKNQHTVLPEPPPTTQTEPQHQRQQLAEPRRVPHQHHGVALRRRLRRRQSDATNAGLDESVRSRLLHMEEQRAAAEARQAHELVLIRQALQELCAVMQSNVHELCTVMQDRFQEMLMELRTWQHR